MLVILGSTKSVKLIPTGQAFEENAIQAIIEGCAAESGINQQPEKDETIRGARNRALDAQTLRPEADIWIGIENGLFPKNGKTYDHAIVYLITRDGKEFMQASKGVEFPAEAVDKARSIGFKTITVGQVMKDMRIVSDNADPHSELGDKMPRAEILRQAISELLRKSGLANTPAVAPLAALTRLQA